MIQFGLIDLVMIASVVLQFTVAVLSTNLAKKAIEEKIPWAMLTIVFAFMTFRRGISLYGHWFDGIPPVHTAEFVALSISGMLCFSMYHINRNYSSVIDKVTHIIKSKQEIQDLLDQLTREVGEDTCGLTYLKSNGESLAASRADLAEAQSRLISCAAKLERLTDVATSKDT